MINFATVIFEVPMSKEKEVNNINRIKAVLADKMKTNKWLAEQLGVAPTTVSKWCTNASQPPLETLVKIAMLLECEISDFVRMEQHGEGFRLQRKRK